ncbi:MAG: bifunctional alpha,alpha-trehalose-phosphate synthase (UDP-forming)/trehalose-phosphatase [Deltaproteobacteria bacterium]|nr:MAG: bifunctional alpha,alpha-trehalose-phosphate synthase (UDP-forming)/trehalose-phosphatase [Deltaproteobacteria bacterium]
MAEQSDATVDPTGPILILANRLPFTVSRTARGLERQRSSGGLVAALEPVLQRRGGTWVGWPGLALRSRERLERVDEPYDIVPVSLTETEVNRYYHGFSNRTLWPLFHSFPERSRFDRRDWQTYGQVNERFAVAASEAASGSDVIWVHDYHLLLCPTSVRRLAPDARIAFFLHIPFPPYDIFRLLPWDREILRGLLDCDLVAFHVTGYAQNFLDCVERRLGARVDRENLLVEHGNRTVQVSAFPIGVDVEALEKRARAAGPVPEVPNERVVLGVDRLDYTKGISDRIRAFERLLELHPEHREKIVLLQIAVPSRSQVSEYRALKREIDELVGRVNGRFATATWSPIRYLYRSLPIDRLAGVYRDAEVALVTPLRDGMNLVAKEYVVCQVGDPGVLVLSHLAGAAETMREALHVNPYNVDETAEAIHRALDMDEVERRMRMNGLQRRERRYNVYAWVRSFLETALATQRVLRPPTDSDFAGWLAAFLQGHRLALLLDYDGTLARLADHPSRAVLTADMQRAIEACDARADTDVAIVSGRSLEDIARMVSLPDLVYAGNHGLEIEGKGVEPFHHEDLVHYRARTEELARELEQVALDGAWIEEKGPTLTFHYRPVADSARRNMLSEAARRTITAAGYQARSAHDALEARPPIGWDKGRAVLHILRSRYGPAWSEDVRVIYVGDDETDEDAFRMLSGLGVTFRVGSADTLTLATRRLPNTEAVGALLQWIARREDREPQAPRPR